MSAREIIINDKGSVTFTEDEAGGNKVSLTGPASIGSDFTIKLPAASALGPLSSSRPQPQAVRPP